MCQMVQNSAAAVSASNQSNQKWQAGRQAGMNFSIYLLRRRWRSCACRLHIYIHGKKQQNTVRLQPPTRDEGNSQTWPWKQYHHVMLRSERQKLVLFSCLLPACCPLVLRRGILEAEEEEEEEEQQHTERLTCKQGSNAWGHGNPVARRCVCSCHKAIATPRTVAPPAAAAIRPEFLCLLHLFLLSFFQLPYHTSTRNLQLLRFLRSLSLARSLALFLSWPLL